MILMNNFPRDRNNIFDLEHHLLKFAPAIVGDMLVPSKVTFVKTERCFLLTVDHLEQAKHNKP